VAAGGGSRLFFRSGLFLVGPESASSNPGPACYKKNGPLTVTDANLLLSRLIPDYFPKICGPDENEPLDFEAAKQKFSEKADEVDFYLFFKVFLYIFPD
jgi:5-oxoprolinase (ATP-hydrolysing)